MFIDRQQPEFSAVSAHKKPVDFEWQATVDEHIEKHGVIDLDDPDAPPRKTPRSDCYLRELEGKRRIAAEKKAQAEHNEALARLADGTAVHRQVSERAPTVKKPADKTIAKIARAAKAAKEVAKPASAKKAPQKTQYVKRPTSTKTIETIARRKAMTKTLKNGGSVPTADWRINFALHQRQNYDLSQIAKKEGLSVVRVNAIKTNKSGYRIDCFERCDIEQPISCLLTGESEHDTKALFAALCSNKMITVDQIKETVSSGSRTMAKLARKYDFDIHSVLRSNKLLGWVLIDDAIDPKKLSHLEVTSGLVGAMDALEQLTLQSRLKAYRLPMSSPDVVLDAVYREFKRVEGQA